MLCLSIAETTGPEAILAMVACSGLVDLFEVRLDRMTDVDLDGILAPEKRRLIVTSYGPTPSGESAIDSLRPALAAGPAYLCADFETATALAAEPRGKRTKLIAAAHPDEWTADDLPALVDQAFATGADIAKIVPTARSLADNFVLLDFLKSESRPIIAFCSGPRSAPSRILATRYGSLVTLCCESAGAKTAEGQLTTDEMRLVYETGRLDDGFRLFGVAGDPVGQSRSPMLFNALFAADRTNAIYLPLPAVDTDDFVATLKQAGLTGASVTLPFKEPLFDRLDGVDQTAAQIRAVNTVVNDKGELVGYNTDAAAALSLLPNDLAGTRVTLLGSGGAARAIAGGLVERGANLTLCGRTADRTQNLAKSVAAAWRPWDEREQIETDIWINSTPIGMAPDLDASPLSRGVLRGSETVFDMVYTPAETALLRMAWETGCTVIRGVDMFLKQAAAQYELWFGSRPSAERMRKALEGEL